MKLETLRHLIGIVAEGWIPMVLSSDVVQQTMHIYSGGMTVTITMLVTPEKITIAWGGNTGGGADLAAAFALALADASRVSVAIRNILNTA
jgi:hypothetical protein